MGLTAAVLSAVAACLAALVAATASVYSAVRQANYQRSQSNRDYCFRQLYELYGPLKMLRQQSKELREKIGAPDQDLTDPNGWTLVDHIEDIACAPESPDYRIVHMLVEINRRIKAILYEKAGLSIEFPPPASFRLFLAHAELLEESWRNHRNQKGAERTPFPREFDKDVDRAIELLRSQLDQR